MVLLVLLLRFKLQQAVCLKGRASLLHGLYGREQEQGRSQGAGAFCEFGRLSAARTQMYR